jgi:hypothetical protein
MFPKGTKRKCSTRSPACRESVDMRLRFEMPGGECDRPPMTPNGRSERFDHEHHHGFVVIASRVP